MTFKRFDSLRCPYHTFQASIVLHSGHSCVYISILRGSSTSCGAIIDIPCAPPRLYDAYSFVLPFIPWVINGFRSVTFISTLLLFRVFSVLSWGSLFFLAFVLVFYIHLDSLSRIVLNHLFFFFTLPSTLF